MRFAKYFNRGIVRSLAQQVVQDWPNLARYHDANAQLLPPAPGESRVVFMGDSITECWQRPPANFFPGKPYVNRGISGQTTPQMLLRFRPDVIALDPKVVVIQGGSNDIAGRTGPATLEDIEGNLKSMVELARANGIRVVLGCHLPITDAFMRQTARRPPATIAALNEWIKNYAQAQGIVYLDYYSAMHDGNQVLRRELTEDGLHPNSEGYAIMAPIAEEAIAAALRSR
jgi:lysophospholipase L1-like esterase